MTTAPNRSESPNIRRPDVDSPPVGPRGRLPGVLASGDRLLSRVPLYPLLLAAYPVLLVYSSNVTEVAAGEIVAPLVAILVVTGIAFAVVSGLWHSAQRAAIVVSVAVVPALSFGSIATLVAPMWPDDPIVRVYLTLGLVWLAAFFISIAIASRLKERLRIVTQSLNVLAIALLVLALAPVVSYAVATTEHRAGANNADIDPVGLAKAEPADRHQRDIYHLVFDRYGSDQALRVGLGIDNSSFTEWLAQRGFDVVDDARANYERTTLSLSSVLSMSLHDRLAEQMGAASPDHSPLYQRIRNSAAAAYLQQLGYRYLHVGSWFHLTASSDIADHVEEPAYRVSFASTIIENSAMPAFDALRSMVTTMSTDPPMDEQAAATVNQFDRVKELAEQPGPKLVFAHFLVPHEPYVFLEDGSFDPSNASFKTQLAYANSQIKELIEPLLALPEDRRPIIILQADEGPYPERYQADRDDFDWSTASADELVTKFGVLSAMYMPGIEGREPLPDGMSLVNTYPEVLRRYFDADLDDWPDRSYTIRGGAPFDQMDVTARLNEAFETATLARADD